jgi:hypothetical protein
VVEPPAVEEEHRRAFSGDPVDGVASVDRDVPPLEATVESRHRLHGGSSPEHPEPSS